MPNLSQTHYQTIRIHLGDGRVVTYTGLAQLQDRDLEVGVRRVEFTEPRPLPEGCRFGVVEDGNG